jgi:hypothetical protein
VSIFVEHPRSQRVVAGSTVVLSVVVTNNLPLPITYRIQRNGVLLDETLPSNSHTAFYTITNVQPAFTNYAFAVSHGLLPGEVLGNPALLTFLADTDRDGLPDEWESAHGLSLNSPDGTSDLDGDSSSNLAEYIAGTDPTDANSYLKFTKTGGLPSTLEFLAVSNRTYTVEWTESLAAGAWRKFADMIGDAAVATNSFYRIRTPRGP